MITLFHAPKSRSSRFIFLLEELSAPYEIKIVNIRRGDGTGARDPSNPHPHGKTPAILDDGALVFESSAIALYLTDKFPKAGIGAEVGDRQRGRYVSWLSYYAGVMEPAWVSQFLKQDVPRGTAGWVNATEMMDFVNVELGKGPYILGERFSAVDILIGTTFALFKGTPLLPKTDLLESYVERVLARPAYARAQKREVG